MHLGSGDVGALFGLLLLAVDLGAERRRMSSTRPTTTRYTPMSKIVEVPIEMVAEHGDVGLEPRRLEHRAPPKNSGIAAVPAASSRPVPSSRPASTGAASPSSYRPPAR